MLPRIAGQALRFFNLKTVMDQLRSMSFASEIVIIICRFQLRIHHTNPGTFTYVPMHLHYMLTEVRLSCRPALEGQESVSDIPE